MRHVIVGAGPAGVVAAETLRRQDRSSEIVILGDEPEPPYSRMALPYMLTENVGEPGTHLRHGDAHYEKLAIDVRLSRVSDIDTANPYGVRQRRRTDLAYDRLLIATGAHPIKPPIEGMDSEGVENCWTLPDARRILAGTQPGSRVVLMGAGFIGCIVLEALAARGGRPGGGRDGGPNAAAHDGRDRRRDDRALVRVQGRRGTHRHAGDGDRPQQRRAHPVGRRG